MTDFGKFITKSIPFSRDIIPQTAATYTENNTSRVNNNAQLIKSFKKSPINYLKSPYLDKISRPNIKKSLSS